MGHAQTSGCDTEIKTKERAGHPPGETAVTDTDVVQNITVKSQKGNKTQIDIVSKKPDGSVRLQETKASQIAPLTKRQKIAHPEIEETGGTVVGKGKPGFPGGTKIPPTKVEVVRPKN